MSITSTIGHDLAQQWFEAGEDYVANTLTTDSKIKLYNDTLSTINLIKAMPNDEVQIIYNSLLEQFSNTSAIIKNNLVSMLAENTLLNAGAYFNFSELISTLQTKGLTSNPKTSCHDLQQVIVEAFKQIKNSSSKVVVLPFDLLSSMKIPTKVRVQINNAFAEKAWEELKSELSLCKIWVKGAFTVNGYAAGSQRMHKPYWIALPIGSTVDNLKSAICKNLNLPEFNISNMVLEKGRRRCFEDGERLDSRASLPEKLEVSYSGEFFTDNKEWFGQDEPLSTPSKHFLHHESETYAILAASK